MQLRVAIALALVASCGGARPEVCQPQPPHSASLAPLCTPGPELAAHPERAPNYLRHPPTEPPLPPRGLDDDVDQWRRYTLADGRFVFHKEYDVGQLVLWDPTTDTVTDLGRAFVRFVGELGVIYREDDQQHTVIADVDPHRDRPALRTLRGIEPSVAKDSTLDEEVIGLLDGYVAVLAVSRSKRAPHAIEEASITCIVGDTMGYVVGLDATLLADLEPANDNAIRGHAVLALRAEESSSPAPLPAGTDGPIPSASVYIVDLDRKRRSYVGVATGAYTQMTNVLHPYLRVTWSDENLLQWFGRLPAGSQEIGATTTVDVATRCFAPEFSGASL